MTELQSIIHFEKVRENAKQPQKIHLGDAAFDLYSCINTIIEPNTSCLIPIGIKMAIPNGYCGIIKDRSGLAVKNRIYTRAGVIDAGYRDEVMVLLENLSNVAFSIECGMRIAQMLIVPVPNMIFKETTSLSDIVVNEYEQKFTSMLKTRDGGFGSSGLHDN